MTLLPRSPAPILELEEQIVAVGGHLDSWIAGTGATDNGAGVVGAVEAARPSQGAQTSNHAAPFASCSGQQVKSKASTVTARLHAAIATDPQLSPPRADQLQLPGFMRRATGPLTLKPEQKLVSVYFNVDNGTGKIRGIYTQGNTCNCAYLRAVDGPAQRPRRHHHHQPQHRRHRHLSFDAVGIPGFQFIQDEADLRKPHAPLQ